MKLNEIYIEQTNRFCDNNCKITAEDILAKAKQKESEHTDRDKKDAGTTSMDKEVFGPKKGGKNAKVKLFRIMEAMAACIGIFILSGTTILAVEGDLTTFIQNIFTDDTTAEFIEEGHVYEILEYQDCGDFALKLIAISGDEENPQVIMDVYVKDDNLAAANDRIFITAYVLGENEYSDKNERANYAHCGGYGIKDAEIPNLYHVTFRGVPVWLSPGNKAVIAVWEIFTDIDPEETDDLSYWSYREEYMLGDPDFTVHEIGYEYRVTVPEGTYADVATRNYHSVILENGDYDFVLDSVEYSQYSTIFYFYIDYPEGKAPANDQERYTIENTLYEKWLCIGPNIEVTVDGEEYTFTDGDLGSIYWSYDGSMNSLRRGYISATIPGIDYFESESIILQSGDQIIDLKESE